MSISELNHFMTYVLDGWILFSAGFVSIGFISFVSKRIQEDLEAEALALAQAETGTIVDTDNVSVAEAVENAARQIATPPNAGSPPATGTPKPPTSEDGEASEPGSPETEEEEAETARLKEVAAVSEELAKTKSKQSDTSSVSVST